MSDQNKNNKETPSTLTLNAKRDQYTTEIRKQKRDEILNTNRDRIRESDRMEGEEVDPDNAKEEENSTLDKLVEEWKNQTFLEADLEDLIDAASSEDKLRQLYGFVGLTKLTERHLIANLDTEDLETIIQSIIDCNIPDVLIKVLAMHNEPRLQREATNLIRLITSGYDDQTDALIDKGVLPCLFELLKSESEALLENLFHTIGNIATDPQRRDQILKIFGLNPFLEAVNKVKNPELIKHGAWALSNFCRGKPLPDINLVEQAIPTLSALFLKEENLDVLTNTAWALSYTSRSRLSVIKMMETNIIPKLIQHMDDQADQVSIPCLRIIGNCCTLPEEQNDVSTYGPEFVPKLLKLLHSQRSDVRREVCWLLSNITAGTSNDINLIFDHPCFIDVIIRIVKTDIPEVSREALWILSNAMKNLDKSKIDEILEYGVLDCFLYVLDDPNPKTVHIALQGIFSILALSNQIARENGDSENGLLGVLDNKGGVKKLENLQTHGNADVYKLTVNILETFYELEPVDINYDETWRM